MIIPIFISHAGCPHRCVFCDQEKITAQKAGSLTPSRISRIIDAALVGRHFETGEGAEVAFYGGTFTGLPMVRMESLLAAVKPYLENGSIGRIRVSTRPDSVDSERLGLLKIYGVKTVELGVQSMDEKCLNLSKRGHTPRDVITAVRLLKDQGFQVGIQLMPGLPGDSQEIFHATIKKVIALKPNMARLYPAVVIRGTELERLYKTGGYRPLTLTKAVDLCVKAVTLLEREGIKVIRIGLMSSPSLLEPGRIVAGPWHPAFGFLVRSQIYHRSIADSLPGPGKCRHIRLFVSKRDVPLLRGHRNQGVVEIEKRTGAKVLSILADDALLSGEIRVEKK